MSRWLIATALVAGAGCNQVFGLDATDLRPPEAGPDARPNVVRLTYQVIAADRDAAVTYAAIPGARVWLGPLDASEPTEVAYSGDGDIEVPPALFDGGAPWRLVYEVPGRPPTELQWQPQLGAHLVLPHYGRQPVPAIEAGSRYRLQPTGSSSQLRHAVYTTGAWTLGNAALVAGDIDYDFAANAVQLGEPAGAPQPDDRQVAVGLSDLLTVCRAVSESASFQIPLSVAPPAAAQAPWEVQPADMVTVSRPELFANRLAKIPRDSSSLRHFEVSYTARGDVPLFTQAPRAASSVFGSQPRLRTSPTLPVVACSEYALPASPVFHQPTALRDHGTPIVYFEGAVRRTLASGQTVTSGLAAVLPGASGVVPVHTAGIPTAVALAGVSLLAADDGSTDGATVPRGSAPLELTATLDSRASYVEAVVHELVGSAVVPRRTFVGIAPRFTLPPSLFTPGALYVLEIRTYDGLPRTEFGDFSIAALPQTATTYFTASFRVP